MIFLISQLFEFKKTKVSIKKIASFLKIDYSGKIVIVFGSEGKGIRQLVKYNCDYIATIPMQGKINSINVSAAVSAILFERQRQISI